MGNDCLGLEPDPHRQESDMSGLKVLGSESLINWVQRNSIQSVTALTKHITGAAG